MDPGRRRRATLPSPRLTLLVALHLALAALLVRWLGGGAGSPAVAGQRTEAAGGAVEFASVPRASEESALARLATPAEASALAPLEMSARRREDIDEVLDADLARIAAQAVRRAGERTDGRAGPGYSHVSLCVVDPTERRVLAALDADRPVAPASNMKLVTTAAAVLALGADGGFVTRFEAARAPENGEIAGALVVRAGADPLFDPAAEGSVRHLLAPAIAGLLGSGVRRVRGDLVLDEGPFLEPQPVEDWPRERWSETCALAGGFCANAGCLTAIVDARELGQLARVEVRPRGHGLRRRGKVVTVAEGPLDVRVGASFHSVTVDGKLPLSAPHRVFRFAHPDPVDLFGRVLLDALEDSGIEVDGHLRRERDAPGGVELARIVTPLPHVLRPINTDSNNACADALLLLLGARLEGDGSRAGGARAVARTLEAAGIPTEGLRQVDGSGLARSNRATARILVSLVTEMVRRDDANSRAWLASLAVAGESGTLAGRMRRPELRGHVRAKTGWISGASALSGVLETPRGPLCFSILVEYPRIGGLNDGVWKPMHEEVLLRLLEG